MAGRVQGPKREIAREEDGTVVVRDEEGDELFRLYSLRGVELADAVLEELVREVDVYGLRRAAEGENMGRWKVQRELRRLMGAVGQETFDERVDSLQAGLDGLEEKIDSPDWRDRR